MNHKIHTLQLTPDWKLINELSQVDRFGGSWQSIENREGQNLKQLKSIATVHSVGASTRIEGSKMTDNEVKLLIENLVGNMKVSKLEERDQQEVVGYYQVLDEISESFQSVDIIESNIMHLHNLLMKHSQKDEWHKGNYKQHSNAVQATNPDGSKHIIFQPTEPGFATEDAMSELIKWYNSDVETHPVIKSALFVYDFLSIHPFQDGNGRMSRLLATLLLLKHGYSWIKYISFEHEIENRKEEYYQVLMQCQQKRPGEDVYPWTIFFLDCMHNIQKNLIKKLEAHGRETQMSPREKMIFTFVENHPGCKSSQIAEKLNIPLPTVKRILSSMVTSKFLNNYGTGAGTNYIVENISTIKKDIAIKLTNGEREKFFTILNNASFIEIKKIILTPLFEWVAVEEWSTRLSKNGLCFKVACTNAKGEMYRQLYVISSFQSISDYKGPTFTLNNRIHIPVSISNKVPKANEYPLKISIELEGAVKDFDFDVMLVYDAG